MTRNRRTPTHEVVVRLTKAEYGILSDIAREDMRGLEETAYLAIIADAVHRGRISVTFPSGWIEWLPRDFVARMRAERQALGNGPAYDREA